MPATHSKPTATWSLPQLSAVEITYTTEDRFGEDPSSLDPDMRVAQFVRGEVVGIDYDKQTNTETETPLGRVELARIGIWEAGEGLLEVLDAHSQEWTHYFDVAQRLMDDDEELFMSQALLIVDRVELVPEARGHGLGLHVLARAVRTWGENSVAVLSAWPVGAEGPVEGPGGRTGAEALSRYWSRLGFTRLPGDAEPVLLGNGTKQDFWDAIAAGCEWTSPSPSS